MRRETYQVECNRYHEQAQKTTKIGSLETKQVADRTASNGSAETKATQIKKRFSIEEFKIIKLVGAEAISLSAFRRAHFSIYKSSQYS